MPNNTPSLHPAACREPFIEIDLLVANSLPCRAFGYQVSAIYQRSMRSVLDDYLDTVQLRPTPISVRCHDSWTHAHRGARQLHPHKRIVLRARLAAGTTQAAARRALDFLRSVNVQEALVFNLASRLPLNSPWQADVLVYSSPRVASLCLGGLWARHGRSWVPLSLGTPCPADNSQWNPRTQIQVRGSAARRRRLVGWGWGGGW